MVFLALVFGLPPVLKWLFTFLSNVGYSHSRDMSLQKLIFASKVTGRLTPANIDPNAENEAQDESNTEISSPRSPRNIVLIIKNI